MFFYIRRKALNMVVVFMGNQDTRKVGKLQPAPPQGSSNAPDRHAEIN